MTLKELKSHLLDWYDYAINHYPLSAEAKRIEKIALKEIQKKLDTSKPTVTMTQIEKQLERFIKTYDIIEFEEWLKGIGIEVLR